MCKWQVSLTSPYNTPLLPAKQTIRISVSYTENDQKFSTLPIAIKCMMFSPSLKGCLKITFVTEPSFENYENYKKCLTWICVAQACNSNETFLVFFKHYSFLAMPFKSREENWTKRICSVSRKENRQIHAQKVVKTVEDFGASNLIEQLVALLNPFIFVCYSDLL